MASVFCPCQMCLMRKRVSPYVRRRHLEIHGLQDNETLMDDASESDNMSITSSNSVLSPQTQNDNQDDEVEDQMNRLTMTMTMIMTMIQTEQHLVTVDLAKWTG